MVSALRGDEIVLRTMSSNLERESCNRRTSSSSSYSARPWSLRNFAAQQTALLGMRSWLSISSTLCQVPSTRRIQTYHRSIGLAPPSIAQTLNWVLPLTCYLTLVLLGKNLQSNNDTCLE